jgi:hypothetical protein
VKRMPGTRADTMHDEMKGRPRAALRAYCHCLIPMYFDPLLSRSGLPGNRPSLHPALGRECPGAEAMASRSETTGRT